MAGAARGNWDADWLGDADPDGDARAPARGAEPESAWSAWSRSIDHYTLYAALFLFASGVLLAFAASPALAERVGADGEPFRFAWRHFAIGPPAFAAMLFVSFFEPRYVRRTGAVLGVLGLVALVLLPALGADYDKNAQRWFSIAGTSVQPSELYKPGFVILCAWLLSGLEQEDRGVARVAASAALGVLIATALCLMAQPDYGQTALFIAVWAAMLFVAGASRTAIAAIVAAGLGALAIGYAVEPHVAARINAFVGGADGHDQVATAAAAIARGGWTGVGLGEGVLKASLPDAHSDFILAVAAEEYGFVGVAALIAAYGFIVLRALWRIALEDAFTRIAGAGLALMIGLQAATHIGVVAGVAPATGVTLPLVSYGGSSLIASGIALGYLLALTRRRSPERAAADDEG